MLTSSKTIKSFVAKYKKTKLKYFIKVYPWNGLDIPSVSSTV